MSGSALARAFGADTPTGRTTNCRRIMKLYSKTPLLKGQETGNERSHVLSHELRTPLAVIGGYAQVLREEVDPKLQDLVVPILENVDRLNHVINALLTWDSADTESAPTSANCDVIALVKEVAEGLNPMALAKSIVLEVTGPESRLASYSSTERIRSVTSELIRNAIKFSENGRIQVRVSASQTTVSLQVIDEGIGLKGESKRLFDPFVQGSSGLNRRFDGLGLGLTLAQKKAKEISGLIKLENGHKKGAIATFSFPRFAQSSSNQMRRNLAA